MKKKELKKRFVSYKEAATLYGIGLTRMQEYAKEDAYEYTFVLTMPNEDVTINVLEVDTFND